MGYSTPISLDLSSRVISSAAPTINYTRCHLLQHPQALEQRYQLSPQNSTVPLATPSIVRGSLPILSATVNPWSPRVVLKVEIGTELLGRSCSLGRWTEVGLEGTFVRISFCFSASKALVLHASFSLVVSLICSLKIPISEVEWIATRCLN